MNRKLVVLALLAVLTFSNLVFSGTYVYPADNPVFEITFPDPWKVEIEEDLLHAAPADESVYLGLWAMGENDLDTALDALDEALGEFMTEIEVGEPEELTINDIPFITVDGNGYDSDEVYVEFAVALFSPDGDNIFIMLYFGTPEAEKTHESDLSRIVKSIQGK